MANTTINELTTLTGSGIADTDKYIIYDVSAGAEKGLTHADLKVAIGTGTFTVTSTGVDDALIVTSTDSGATAAPDVVYYRNSSTPAASDLLGNLVFRGKNSSSANTDYATIGASAVAVGAGAEEGEIQFSTMKGGTSSVKLRIKSDGGIAIGTNTNSARVIDNRGDITGSATAYANYAGGIFQPDVTGSAIGYASIIGSNTISTSTLTNLIHFRAGEGTIGANTTVQNQMGLYVQASSVSAQSNYGVFIQGLGATSVAAGKSAYGIYTSHAAATNGASIWNIYASGSAPSYIQGKLGLGGAGAQGSSSTLHVVGTIFSTGSITSTGQIAGSYSLLANGATAMALGTNSVAKVTPTGNATYTTTVAPAGARATVIILTSGTTSYTITFGGNFKSTGTLATGTVSGKIFVVSFVSDGTNMIETGRTVAI